MSTRHTGGQSGTLDKGHTGQLCTHGVGRKVWFLSQRSHCKSRCHNLTAFPSITKSPARHLRSSPSPQTVVQLCQGMERHQKGDHHASYYRPIPAGMQRHSTASPRGSWGTWEHFVHTRQTGSNEGCSGPRWHVRCWSHGHKPLFRGWLLLLSHRLSWSKAVGV